MWQVNVSKLIARKANFLRPFITLLKFFNLLHGTWRVFPLQPASASSLFIIFPSEQLSPSAA
jgi:hypothetical protein